MKSRDVVLCHPVRTAIGTFNGTLKGTPATELGATVVRETVSAEAGNRTCARDALMRRRQRGQSTNKFSNLFGDWQLRLGDNP